MGHLVQMAGLTVQNFVSAAVGIVVAVALVRGVRRTRVRGDRELLGGPRPRHRPGPGRRPRSLSRSAMVSQGVVQNLDGFRPVTTLFGRRPRRSPAAGSPRRRRSKELGT